MPKGVGYPKKGKKGKGGKKSSGSSSHQSRPSTGAFDKGGMPRNPRMP